MLDCPDLFTLEGEPCRECGRSHRFRVAASGNLDIAARPLCGFFASCPATGQRAWFVIRLPDDHPVRFVEAGPPDDERWQPADAGWARQEQSERSEAKPGPLASPCPSRGVPSGGLRVPGPAPDLLRRALGCPHGA